MSDDQPTDPGPIPPPPGAVPPPPPPPMPPPMAYEPALEPSATTVKRGFAGRLGAGVVGLAVLGGGLAYAVSQSGDGGGGSTPEAAAQSLFDAIADEDVLGLLDVLPAGERRAFQGPLESMADELGRLGVVGDDLDLGAVRGLDLEFEDLTFETEELADGIASVRLTGGTAIASVDPGDLPIGDELREVVEEFSGEPIEIDPVDEERETIEPGEGDFELVAIEEDGTWRVSLFYSIAEAARRSEGLEAPDFGAGIDAAGEDSPEAAVEALLRTAIEERDLAGALALLPPDEMAALHDYAPLFLDDAQSALDQETEDLEVSIADLELEAEEDGSAAAVTIAGFSVDANMGGDEFSATYDGECFTFEGPDGESQEQCTDDPSDLGPLAGVLRLDGAQLGGLSAVEVDGEWYVSPTRTMLDSVVGVLRAFDDDALSSLPEMLGGFFGMSEAFFEESAFSEVGEAIEESDLPSIDEIDEPQSPTTTADGVLDPPSIDVMIAMLQDVQGYSPEQADCTATEVFAAGFTDDQLSRLQTGEIPEEVSEELFDIIDACQSAG